MLLEVSCLSVGVGARGGKRKSRQAALLPAIESLSFSIAPGEIFGLVGESGCGKSLTALTVAGVLPEQAEVTGGQILFEGEDLLQLQPERLRQYQGSRISMVFQEPMTSLNPLIPVGRQVGENLRLHTALPGAEIRRRVIDTLARTGLPDPERVCRQYPHQLSGGMRQRVMIAMAVVCRPSLLIADEPTTALDVTVQAKILALLREINQRDGTSILFISHDLGVVGRLCGRVGVMYAGRLVETGRARDVFDAPAHEYTKGLIGSLPVRGNKGGRLAAIPGQVPPLGERTAACPFAPRCLRAQQSCFTRPPAWVELGGGHSARCIYAGEAKGDRA